MLQPLKQIVLLASIFLILQAIIPKGPPGKLTAAAGDAPLQTTITYQKGDGKGLVSETDDGTLSSKFVEGTLSRFSEYQGEGSENSLLLKRLLETSGGETTVETKRAVIKFPNIIGSGAGQIPRVAKITSATLKLVMNAFSSPAPLSASVYRILEDWSETESGYLKSPGWRGRHPAGNESDTPNQWTNFGASTPTSSESPPVTEAIQAPNILGGTVSFDITKAVENWADGKPNNGVMLKLFEETPGGTLRLVSFYSSEWSETKLRPLLEVTYTTEVAAPPPAPAPAPTPAPTATPTPPAPTPTPPTPAPAPAPKPAAKPPTPKPAPAPTPVPVPPEPEKPTPPPTPAPEPEERPKPNIITSIFTIIQNRILETWESIIRLFR
ncbi:MAG: DNRLRE domain-containing protein, partial [Candidatus Sungiibacteriota bacterium]